MIRISLRSLTRRVSVCGHSRQRPVSHFVWTRASSFGVHQLSSSTDDSSTQQKKQLHDAAREINVDVLEELMKQAFGDRATWDHEKLRKLTYGQYSMLTHALVADDHSRLSRFTTGFEGIRRVCCRRLSTRRRQSIFSTDDARRAGSGRNSLP
jgi:hypothetical protein